jgi:L-ascorbate metabolism protein UlaG (beta-lactamase superfamily)
MHSEPVEKNTKEDRRWFIHTAVLGILGSILKSEAAWARGSQDGAVNLMSEEKAAKTARTARYVRRISSPQWRDGKFRNTLPESTQFSKALGKIFSDNHRTPVLPVPFVSRKKSDFDTPPESGLRVTWIGHSSLLVEIEGKRFLTDPVWGERASPVSFAGPKRFFPAPLPLAEIPQLDAVVLSHDHYDHYCRETLEFLAKTDTPFIVPLGVGDRLEDMGVHHSRIKEFDWWEEVRFENVKLACVPARHFSGRTLWDRNKTLWCGWTFLGQDKRFYFSGDTAYCPEFKDIGLKYGPFDIVAMESAAYNSAWPDVHIGPEQAVQACLDAKGKMYLPIHWATFSLAFHSWTEPGERLMVKAKSVNLPLLLPKPGESVELSAIPDSMFKKWWPDLPWESAEQAPVKSTGT